MQSFQIQNGIEEALSPDGKYQLSISKGNSLKLRNLKENTIQIFQSGFSTSQVESAVFSPNGQQVLTGNNKGTVCLWDLANNTVQNFQGHKEAVSALAFSPDGQQVLTGSNDKTAKLWNLEGKELHSFQGHTRMVNAVAFSPACPEGMKCPLGDGQHVLTSSHNTAKLWDLQGNEQKKFQSGSSFMDNMISVAFSPDGQQIITGNWYNNLNWWDLEGVKLDSFYDPSLSFGSIAFSSDGKRMLTGSELPVNFSPKEDTQAKLWDLEQKKLIQTFKGHTRYIASVAFSSDGRQVLTGSDDNTVRLWDLQGNELQTFQGHTSAIMSVAFSPNSQQVLSSSWDGTTKLWDLKTDQEIATLITVDSSDWILTTPSGLFDATPRAIEKMYYAVFYKDDSEVIEMEQLKERYYEPGLLQKLLSYSDEEIRSVENLDIVELYPEIDAQINPSKEELNIQLKKRNGGLGKVSLFINGKEVKEDINPPKGFGKKRDSILSVDLRKYARYYLLDSINTIAIRAYNQEGWLKSQAYELAYRPNFVSSKGSGRTFKFNRKKKDRQPKLYAVIVGSSNYSGNQLDLKYAAKDARAMTQALQLTGKQLFIDSLEIFSLTTNATDSQKQPSKTNIKAAFQAIKDKAKAEDVLVVYFSGHGVTYGPAEKAQFYYLTKDIRSENISDDQIRNTRTISSEELTKWINDIPALKQVLILDACHSGKIVESLVGKKALNSSQIRALDRMKDRTGMFVISGSAADKVSYEASQYGQGILTYSLLQGISGLALTDDKRVDVMDLFQHARDKVPDLAKGIGGIQTPMLAFPHQGASFDIGIKPDSIIIPIAEVKPVFIRNIFLDEQSLGDELGLTKKLESYFKAATAKGAEANFIYVNIDQYANGHSMSGLYKIENGIVNLRIRLNKGIENIGQFTVQSPANDLDQLIEKIIEKAESLIK